MVSAKHLVQTVSSFEAEETWKEWERLFNECYIQPVLSTLDQNLAVAMEYVANDGQQGYYITLCFVIVFVLIT